MKIIILNIVALIMTITLFIIALLKGPETVNVVDIEDDLISISSEYSSSDDLFLPPDNTTSYIDDYEDSVINEIYDEVVSSKPPASNAVSSKPPASSAVSSKPPASSAVSSKPPASSAVSSKPPTSSAVSSKPPTSSVVSSKPPANDDLDMNLIDVIAGAVQREIVGVSTIPVSAHYEAYKAQAIASHSYMEYHKKNTGEYPSMPYTTPNKKTIELVKEVFDKLIYYNGNVINASYHAAAGGHTQSSEYIWGGTVGYLRGVPSKYDDYDNTYKIHRNDLEQKLKNVGINVYGEPETWFDLSNAILTDGGYLKQINICGTGITGRKLREEILGPSNLKSPKVVSIIVENDVVLFMTKGFGHGGGLSQLGARGYAEFEGWNYEQILTHYYTGVTIS